MNRAVTITALPILVLALSGCNKTETPTDPTASNVTITVSPDPMVAAASTDSAYQWAATANITLREDAGVGLTVGAVNPKIEAASGGIVVASTDAIKVGAPQVRASGNRISSRGSLTLSVDFLYTRADGTREALVTVTFTFYDDNGYAYTQTAQFKVV